MRVLRLATLALLGLTGLLPAYSQVLIRTIPAGSTTANTLAWDGEAFWVGDNSANILRVDPQAGDILDTITSPVIGSDGLAWDGQNLWTISSVLSRPWIYKMDTGTGAVIDSIPDLTTGRSGGMTWSNNNNFWLSRNFPGDSLLRVDSTSGMILQRFTTEGAEPRGVAYDGTNLWYSSVDTDADRIYRVDPATGETTWSFELPEHVSQPNRRLRGITWVSGHLWIVAYEQSTTQIKLHEYDVGSSDEPDIEIEQTSHNFGETEFGLPVQWAFDVMNVGNATLTLDSAVFTIAESYRMDGPDFPVSVVAGGARAIRTLFDPTHGGVFDDTLTIYSDDPDEPMVALPVTGVCLADEGNIEVAPLSLDYGTVWVAIPGWSTSRIVEIHNIGFGDLTINDVEVSLGDDFFTDPVSFPVVVNPQSVYYARVWFDPNAPSFYDGVLSISSDDADEPTIDVSMFGQAQNEPFEPGETFWTYFASGESTDNGINAVAGMEDVNGDGSPDAIACSGNGSTYCFNGTSSGVADTFWTFNTRAEANHSGAVSNSRALTIVGDLSGDDVNDVIIGTGGGSRSVYAISGATGTELWMFDTRIVDGTGAEVNAVQVAGDLNGDFVDDIVAAIGTEMNEVIAVSGANGELVWEGPDDYDSFYVVAVVRDVSGDGITDLVGGSVGVVVGISGADGGELWNTPVSNGSTVFDLENMGNANPDENESEDIAVASSNFGIFSIDGADGDTNWVREISGTTLNQVTAGSDMNGDDIREVYAGSTGGHVYCLDGHSGEIIWDEIADDESESILSLVAIEDINGDGLSDIECGTLGDYIVVMDGLDGHDLISTPGDTLSAPVDAVGVLRDIDGTGHVEILAGNREGVVRALAGGGVIDDTPPEINPGLPKAFGLSVNFPNPFNPETVIPYSIAERRFVSIEIYDVLGRKTATVFNGIREAGNYFATWNGSDFASGVYFARMQAGDFASARKMVLMK